MQMWPKKHQRGRLTVWKAGCSNPPMVATFANICWTLRTDCSLSATLASGKRGGTNRRAGRALVSSPVVAKRQLGEKKKKPWLKCWNLLGAERCWSCSAHQGAHWEQYVFNSVVIVTLKRCFWVGHKYAPLWFVVHLIFCHQAIDASALKVPCYGHYQIFVRLQRSNYGQ